MNATTRTTREIGLEELQANWVGDPPAGGWKNYVRNHGQPLEIKDVKTMKTSPVPPIPNAMTVKQLREALATMPDDALVHAMAEGTDPVRGVVLVTESKFYPVPYVGLDVG